MKCIDGKWVGFEEETPCFKCNIPSLSYKLFIQFNYYSLADYKCQPIPIAECPEDVPGFGVSK